ncbi:MAG: outer membrane protein assembly factor BamE [Deltaproteobacteria bacterium]
MRLLIVLLASLALSGCGRLVYKMDVQQGNFVTSDLLARVKTGMTKAEVRQILGTPLLTDVFHANRWDYYFSSEKNGRAQDRKLLSIFFENDKVASIQGDAHPPAPPPVGQASTPPVGQASTPPVGQASTPPAK